MKGLHYRSLTAALALLLLAVPTARLIRGDWILRQHAQRETQGLQSAWDVLQLVRLLQEQRGWSNLVLNGSVSAEAPLSSTEAKIAHAFAVTSTSLARLHDTILSNQTQGLLRQWADLSAAINRGDIQASTSFHRHTALINQALALVEQINDEAAISLGETLPDSHLREAAVRLLPRLTESLGKLRGEGAPLLGHKSLSNEQRAQLAEREGTARALASSVRRRLNLAISAAPTSYGPLTAARSQATEALDRALKLTQVALLSGKCER